MLERDDIEFILKALLAYRMARRNDERHLRGENLVLERSRLQHAEAESDVAKCSRLRIILKKALDGFPVLP